jgi:hypothetical protein
MKLGKVTVAACASACACACNMKGPFYNINISLEIGIVFVKQHCHSTIHSDIDYLKKK